MWGYNESMSARKRNADSVNVTEQQVIPKKRTARRASAKKTVAKKPSAKVTPDTSSTTIKSKKTVKKSTDKVATEAQTVQLPTDAGPRLKSKAKFLHDVLDDLQVPAYRIAYISAVCFVLIGAFTAFLELTHIPNTQSAQICATGICTNTLSETTGSTTESVTKTVAEVLNPEVQMLDLVPSIINEDIKLSFKVLNGTNVAVSFLSSVSGGLYQADISKLSPENYRMVVPAAALPPAQYSIRIFVSKLDGTGTYSFPGGRFEVPKMPIDENIVIEQVPVEETPTTQKTNDSSSTVSDTSVTNKPPTVTQPVDDLNAITKTPEVETINVENDDVGFLPSGTAVIEKPFAITIADSLFSGREAIRVTAPTSYYSIELFIRSQLATEARYLGLMNKEYDRWIYSFDTVNLPNGAYELFARAKSPQGLHTTDSIVIRVSNEKLSTEPTRLAPATTTATQESQRNFYLYDAAENAEVITTDLSSVVSSEVTNILSKDEAKINELLKRYAIAKQSGNTIVEDAVKQEFKEQKDRLVTSALLNPETKDIVAQIDIALEERISDMQRRVDTFENIRASRENKLVSTDSDNDGISDYDETTIYKTDPNNPDTDQDGFIDGIEIARGFDPLDERPEVPVMYELPQEVIGLERADILAISKVEPFVQINDEDTTVMAEISGIGLPNTFATIYVFSTPTIVTVKTANDGSFTYRFEKELEDGTHEVYVAFTDNSGDILAHSQPFRFIKQAQAFSPVGAETESVITTAPNLVEVSTLNAIRLILAMAIIVLGFILLMLGINLRTNVASPKNRNHSLGV